MATPSSILRVALRNVRRHRRRSLITLLAMFLALAVMVVIRGGLNAMNSVLRDSIVTAHIGAVQVHRRGFLRSVEAAPLDLDLSTGDELVGKLRRVPHVTAVAARIPWGGMASLGERTAFTALLAVDPVEEARVCPRRFAQLVEGRPVGPAAPGGAVVTRPLLARLGARLGDKVALLANDRDGVLNAVEVEVAGVLPDAGMLATDKKVALVPLAAAQELLRMPGRATELAVGVDDIARVDDVAAALRAALGPDYEVSTWHDLTSFVDETMEKQDQAVSWIAATFLLMALLGVVNTMLIAVRERTREIGTMMAVGLRRRHIMALFVLEAAIIGVVGGGLGILVGGGLVHHFGAVGLEMRATGGTSTFTLYPWVTAAYVVRVFLAATLGAVVAALYPALRAARLRPVEALTRVT